ncbi:MAG: family peptidase [Glaciihabitans sp.]|nr:family peptidase [Glaciihabitans sp.]
MTAAPRPGAFVRRTVATVATTTTILALSLIGTAPASAADRTTFDGSKPTWAISANDAGTPAADTSIEGEIYLPLRDAKGAEALATAVSTPTSPLYRHPVSPTQWIDKFAPTPAASAAVVKYLISQGVTITAVPKSREYVVFRGTADQLDKIFGADLHSYNYGGRKLIAPSVAPSVPASIGSLISGVSIDQSRMLTHPDNKKQGAIASATTPQVLKKAAVLPTPPVLAPCSSYYQQNSVTYPAAYGKTVFPTIACGYTPSQLRSAYGLAGLSKSHIDGSGQTVAIIDAYASPTIVSDVNTYSAAEGEPGLKAGQYKQIVPSFSAFKDQAACQEPSGWQTEQTLDVESVHGIAPGAGILYVGGYNCGGGLDVAMSTIVDNKLANIVSNSYSDATEALPQNTLSGENNLYMQAAAEGIGLYFSSGDDGDLTDLGEPAQPTFPASDPFVTGVGGTSIGVDQKGALAFETGWGDQLDQVVAATDGTLSYVDPLPGSIFGGGAGGGSSSVFKEPAYQKGVVPNSLAKGSRVEPDIASLADPYTGFVIGFSPITNDTTLATGPFANATYGGTSLASPLTAGQIAIVQQATHSTIGFANPTLYRLNQISPNSFRDVKHASIALAYQSHVSGHNFLVTLDQDSSLKTTNGFDEVTGLGGLTYGLLTLLAQGKH